MDPELFAGLPVRTLGRARAWYDRFFGEVESFAPNEDECVWTLGERRHVYVEVVPEHAGGGMVSLFVGDLDAVVGGIAERGIEPVAKRAFKRHSSYSPRASESKTPPPPTL